MRAFLFADIVGAALLATAPGTASADDSTTSTGYPPGYAVRRKNSPGSFALIMVRGMISPPDGVVQRVALWAERIARQGFRVCLRVMPWSSHWDGICADATSTVDARVDVAAKDVKRVVAGGHRMGTMLMIVHRPSSVTPGVAGKFNGAPVHMPDIVPTNSDFWRGLAASIRLDKSLEPPGKGKEQDRFEGHSIQGVGARRNAMRPQPRHT